MTVKEALEKLLLSNRDPLPSDPDIARAAFLAPKIEAAAREALLDMALNAGDGSTSCSIDDSMEVFIAKLAED